ncbi:MAG: multidrug transporter MurJ, partial [Psychromonas sp.]|nr:multidrug transporter MurJ [Psychromonas sp.]
LSATLNAAMLWFGLYKQGVYQKQTETIPVLIRIVISGLVMAGAMLYLNPTLEQWATFSLFESAYKLFALIATGITSYFICAALIGLRIRHFKIS